MFRHMFRPMFRPSPRRRPPRSLIWHLATLFAVIGLLAGCAAETPDPAEPSAQAEAKAETTPDGPTVGQAMAKLRGGDAAGAATLLEEIIQGEPGNVRAHYLLGFAHQRDGNTDAAHKAYERTLELDPTEDRAAYNLATLEAKAGNAEAALVRLEALAEGGRYDLSQVTLDPGFAGLRQNPRFQAFLMQPEDFTEPFVENARILNEWVGEGENDEFGWIARNIGDVDGDGVDDVVTSAPSREAAAGGPPGGGKVYAYSGKSGELLWSQAGEAGSRLGMGVETAGDVDGDGVGDVVAGAPGADRVFVYAGATGETLLTVEGGGDGEFFGRDAIGVGDVDDDGHGDLLIGAPRAGNGAGRVIVASGRSGETLIEWLGAEPGERRGAAVGGGRRADGGFFLLLGAPDAGEGDRGQVIVHDSIGGDPAFVIESDEEGAELGGMFLSIVGDVDGDGHDDVYASDWSHNAKGPATGKIVVHSGTDGSELLAIEGEPERNGFGIGPADAGDVDGDGHADLIVGAWQHESAAPRGGKVYLFSGRDGSLIRTWTGRIMGETFGFDATGMGDVDGDGAIDFLVTSAWSAKNGAKSGRVYILAGPSS